MLANGARVSQIDRTILESRATPEILGVVAIPSISIIRSVPRPPRHIFANECYHVLNRANRRADVFHDPADYASFIRLMAKAQEHIDLPVFAACLMPNHVHLVVRPNTDVDVARWMQWLFTTHARHYHEKYATTGHVWQGRYKHFPVQDDEHLLTVLRYVERNAKRASLVAKAEEWRWGSLQWRTKGATTFELARSPVALPASWVEFVNLPQTAAELEAIRTSVNRQRPFGHSQWVEERARGASLQQTLHAVGRPRKRRSGTNS